MEETIIDECIRSIRYALNDDHCISEEAANHLKHYIKQERRAAAEAMRERCTAIAYEIQESAITQIVADTADHIRRQMLKLPLDTPDDRRE